MKETKEKTYNIPLTEEELKFTYEVIKSRLMIWNKYDLTSPKLLIELHDKLMCLVDVICEPKEAEGETKDED